MYRVLIPILIMVSVCCPAAGRGRLGAGMFNSFKGIGATIQFTSQDGLEFDAIDVYADTYGIMTGRTRNTGVFTNYTHNYVYRILENEWIEMRLYAGAGIGAGYVHDHEPGIFSNADIPLEKPKLFAFSLACGTGVQFSFSSVPALNIRFSVTMNPGITIGRNRVNGGTLVSMYKNGIYHIPYPQVSFIYRLGR